LGIVNVTPDSFSDGGETPDSELAIERAFLLIEQGADILDIGGESTRPGAEAVSIDEELSRVIPVIEVLAGKGMCVSVDTRNATVMQAAIQAGAAIVNDVTALQGDPQSLDVIADSSASVILMHMQGQPGSMQVSPIYEDVVAEVGTYLASRIQACENAGVDKDRIAIDPGIGFGKTRDHNLALLKNLHAFRGVAQELYREHSKRKRPCQALGRVVVSRLGRLGAGCFHPARPRCMGNPPGTRCLAGY